MWLPNLISGPQALENPYYEISQFIGRLAPLRYPRFLPGCALIFLGLLSASRRKHGESKDPAAVKVS